MKLYTTIAPRWGTLDGCIERCSAVRQDTRREGTDSRRASVRVAWRILGSDENRDGLWMVSCRTPEHMRGISPHDGLTYGGCETIGDGSDEAMIAWVTERVRR